MADDDDRIDKLEARLQELESQHAELRQQLARAEIDQWRGRIEDLEVQLDLGSMEARDRLAPFVEELRNRWLDAKRQADQAASSASSAVDQLRTGLEQAMDDIRSAVRSAKERLDR
jgi:chromosome segregation ATPase